MLAKKRKTMGYVYKRFAAAGRFVALLIVISAFGAAIPVMGALKSGKLMSSRPQAISLRHCSS